MPPFPEPLPASPARPRILLAEDDPIVSAIVEQKLSGRGMQVTAYADGKEALDAALAETAASAYDLIILDVSLPGLDGFEVLHGIRDCPALGRVPVMMLTGKRRDEDVRTGLKLGADDYLIKPFLPFELLRRVQKLLAGGRKA